jgi:hypothetical protein
VIEGMVRSSSVQGALDAAVGKAAAFLRERLRCHDEVVRSVEGDEVVGAIRSPR